MTINVQVKSKDHMWQHLGVFNSFNEVNQYVSRLVQRVKGRSHFRYIVDGDERGWSYTVM